MKILDLIVRFLVGGLFIFSGLVKINDPIGTKIKLEEYFEVFAGDFGEFFQVFIPAALVIALAIITMEVLIGVAVLINYRMKISAWILLGMIMFFTFLTFYSAYFNKVTDCGCFGDAIPLTPWESFYKDTILLVLIIYLFFKRNTFSMLLPEKASNYSMIAVGLMTLSIGLYAIAHLPFIDFRAYKIGDNIALNMQPEEDPVFEYIFRKEGKLITSEKYLLADDGYEYVDYKIKNQDRATPKISDYNVWNEEVGDFTMQSLSGTKLMLIFQDVEKSDIDEIGEITTLANDLEGKIDVLALTASSTATFENFRHHYQLAVPYYFTDATVLKAMVRSNPGIILLKNGTVLGKWHNNDVPNAKKIISLATSK